LSIATRTGDDGDTGLFGGPRVKKDHPRVRAYGAVDELNACVGLARAEGPPNDVDLVLAAIQSDLFDLGAELATPRENNPLADRVPPFTTDAVAPLDAALKRYEAECPELRAFILPGGVKTAATLHVARVVCRRAEREVVSLAESEGPQKAAIVYLNRLSDLLFVMARACNLRTGTPEPPWRAKDRR
jgi:cob(I)alamin adenosyltransferase